MTPDPPARDKMSRVTTENEALTDAPTWTPAEKPVFNSPAADLNQLRNEAKRIADAAPGQPVHDAVLSRARALATALDHDLGLPEQSDGLSYADLAVLLSQSR